MTQIAKQVLVLEQAPRVLGMGWRRDNPDARDFTLKHEKLHPLFERLQVAKALKAPLPAAVSLKEGCSPVEDQGALGSCTANAGAGLMEFCERKFHGKHIDASRLFLYKVTRDLLHLEGDTGATLRDTLKAMAMVGIATEEIIPYDIAHFDEEPSALAYAIAQNYQAVSYFRLDSLDVSPAELLSHIKVLLAKGYPSMFGFVVYSSISQAAATGRIPYPAMASERVLGGHAVDAVGYDDNLVIKNSNPGGQETKGALLIRNSWGTGWGDAGYGWLPYKYVLKGLAVDWWSLFRAEYLDSGAFN